MKIRKIKKTDLERCAAILEAAYKLPPYNEVFRKMNAYRYTLAKYNNCKAFSFVVINNKNIIVAFVFVNKSTWSDGPQAILEEIVVDPNEQGKGLGKKIMLYVHKYLKFLNVTSVMLWAKKDKKLLRFYKNNGYVVATDFVVMFKNF